MSCAIKEKIKDRIVEIVRDKNGLKPIELVTTLTLDEVKDFNVGYIEELVREGRLQEVCYTLKPHTYKVRTFLLPGDALIEINFGLR